MLAQKDAMTIVVGLIVVGAVVGAILVGGPALLIWIFG